MSDHGGLPGNTQALCEEGVLKRLHTFLANRARRKGAYLESSRWGIDPNTRRGNYWCRRWYE